MLQYFVNLSWYLGGQTMACVPNPVQNKIYFIYTNKVLLAHNPMHLFTDCLLSHHNGRVKLWDKTIWPQTQDIYYLPLYRKFADPSAVIIPIDQSLHPQQ